MLQVQMMHGYLYCSFVPPFAKSFCLHNESIEKAQNQRRRQLPKQKIKTRLLHVRYIFLLSARDYQYSNPNFEETSLSFLSSVQIGAFVNIAEAIKCISM